MTADNPTTPPTALADQIDATIARITAARHRGDNNEIRRGALTLARLAEHLHEKARAELRERAVMALMLAFDPVVLRAMERYADRHGGDYDLEAVASGDLNEADVARATRAITDEVLDEIERAEARH
jgi:hypothetical protein